MSKNTWDFAKHNQRIYENHYKECVQCETDVICYFRYCIVCGTHLNSREFCGACGDVVCYRCCPINEPHYYSEFVRVKDLDEIEKENKFKTDCKNLHTKWKSWLKKGK